MNALLETRDLSFRAGGRALVDKVSLSLHPGELLAVVGPNGAGKSTLLRLLAGELAPDEGAVCLSGRDLRDYPARELARKRSVLPQQTVLQFAFTVAEIVEMGRSPHRHRFRGMDGDGWSAAQRAMEQTDILPLSERGFPTLSGGEQARTTLARVLAQETDVLLLDEPTTSLDLRHQELVMSLAQELAGSGRAVLVIVHDLNLAGSHANRIALLHEGCLAGCGSPWEVLTEETVSQVFDHPVTIVPHPLRDCPLVLPSGRTEAPLREAVQAETLRV